MKLNLKKPSPLKRNACNKSTITVCKNSMQLRWGMEIRMGNSTFIGYDDGVYIEYISYDSDPTVSTATVRLSENIDSQIAAGTDVTFHGDRGLNFHPDRKITGLNVIDSMIFWTDNHSEPKKINIERGKLGSLSSIYGAGFDGSDISPEPYTWYGLGDTCRGGLTMPDGSPSLACFSDFDQHTKLIAIEKHIMDCEKSTLDCDIFGCTNAAAINWNPAANTDDGSCILPLPPVYGCDDGTWGVANSNACNRGINWWNTGGSNFNALNGGGTYGNTDDYNINDTNLCVFAGSCEICDPVTGGTMGDPTCGDCIDSNATNTGSGSLDCLGNSGGTDYGCCQYCLDPTATNYYAGANDCLGVAGGSNVGCCSYPPPVYGCMDPAATNFNPLATLPDPFAPCTFIYGCTDSLALNYNSFAGVDDGSCVYCVYGCTDATSINYDLAATCDDGSCTFTPTDPTASCETAYPAGGGNIEIADATGVNGEPWNNVYPYVRACPKQWIRPCEIVMSHPDFTDANGASYQTQSVAGDDWVKTSEMSSVISPNNYTLFEAVNGHERLVHWRLAIKGTGSGQNLINRYFLEALTKEFNNGNLDAGSTLMHWNWGNQPSGLPTQTQATDGIGGTVSLSTNAVKANMVKALGGGYYTKVFNNFQDLITFFNGLTANNGEPVLLTPLTLSNNIEHLQISGGPYFRFNNNNHINPLSGSTTNISSYSYMMTSCGHASSPNWLTPSIETCESGVNRNDWDGITNAYSHTSVNLILP